METEPTAAVPPTLPATPHASEPAATMPHRLLDHGAVTPIMLAVYAYTQRYTAPDGRFESTREEISDLVGCSMRTVQEAYLFFVAWGFMVIRRQEQGWGKGTITHVFYPCHQGEDNGELHGEDNGELHGEDNGEVYGEATPVLAPCDIIGTRAHAELGSSTALEAKATATAKALPYPSAKNQEKNEADFSGLEPMPPKTAEAPPRTTPPALPVALEFVQGWNTAHPKTLNRHTNQLLDQAAVQQALEMEGRTLGELTRIRDWLGTSGRISAYQRPQRWFQLTGSGTRVLDQIDLEMAAWEAKQKRRAGPSRASPADPDETPLQYFQRREREKAEEKARKEQADADRRGQSDTTQRPDDPVAAPVGPGAQRGPGRRVLLPRGRGSAGGYPPPRP